MSLVKNLEDIISDSFIGFELVTVPYTAPELINNIFAFLFLFGKSNIFFVPIVSSLK